MCRVCFSGSSVHHAVALALSWKRHRLHSVRLLLSPSLSVHYSTELQIFVCDMVVGGAWGGFLRGMPMEVCMKVTLSGCWMDSFTIPSPFLLCLQFFTTVICLLYYYIQIFSHEHLEDIDNLELRTRAENETSSPCIWLCFVFSLFILFQSYFIFFIFFEQSALGNESPVVVVVVSYE